MNTANVERLKAWLRHDTLVTQPLFLQGQVVTGEFSGCRLTSAFQPVRRLEDKVVVATEAYARVWAADAGELSPYSLFARTAGDSDLVALDRLCRNLHAANYFGRVGGQGDLILNVNERLLPAVADHHGDYFVRVLRAQGVDPSRVIIDIPASAGEDFLLLALAITNYRRNSFRIALNARTLAEGRRLLTHFEPNFLFVDIRDFPLAEILAELVNAAARIGCPIIAKRVEAPAHLAVARQAGVALAQGYVFDVPQALAGQFLERRAS